jgi:hypothetical protein
LNDKRVFHSETHRGLSATGRGSPGGLLLQSGRQTWLPRGHLSHSSPSRQREQQGRFPPKPTLTRRIRQRGMACFSRKRSRVATHHLVPRRHPAPRG